MGICNVFGALNVTMLAYNCMFIDEIKVHNPDVQTNHVARLFSPLILVLNVELMLLVLPIAAPATDAFRRPLEAPPVPWSAFHQLPILQWSSQAALPWMQGSSVFSGVLMELSAGTEEVVMLRVRLGFSGISESCCVGQIEPHSGGRMEAEPPELLASGSSERPPC